MSTTPTHRWSRFWEHCRIRWQLLRAACSRDPQALLRAQAAAEQQTQKVIERLRQVSDVAGDAGINSWEFDLKTNVFNWMSLRQKGFGLDDVPLPDYLPALISIVLEEDRHIVIEGPSQALANNQEAFSYRYRLRDTGGRIRHINNVCRMLRNSSGRFRYLVGVSVDITEAVESHALLTQRAEENRRLVERLSMATESADIGSWELDLVAQRFLWVESAMKSLGLAPADYGSLEDFAQQVVPADRNLLRDAIKRCVVDGTLRFSLRYRFAPRAGGLVYVQTYGRVLVDSQGRPVRAFGVSWDVSDLELAHQRLEARMQEARELSERLGIATMAAGVATHELDLLTSRMLWRENSLAAWQGILPEDGDLRPLAQHMHPEDRGALAAAIEAATQEGRDIIQYTYRIAAGEGRWAHIRNYAKIYLDPQGRAVRTLGAAWDITKEVAAKEKERLQAEHERALLQRLSVVTHAAQINLWEFDLKTRSFEMLAPGLEILGVNDQAMPDVLPALKRIMVPEDRNAMENAAADALARGLSEYNFIYRARGTDGELHHIKNFVRVLRSDSGKPFRLIGVTWDHSEEVAAAARLQAQVDAARELSERLSLATLGAGVSMWEIDMIALRFVWVENTLPPTASALAASHDLREYSKHVHPDDRFIMINAIKAAAQEGSNFITYTYRFHAAGGELIHLRNDVKVYFNADKRALRMIGVTTDVTKEVLAAEQQRQRDEQERALLQRLSVVVQAAKIMLWEFDLKTRSFHMLGEGFRSGYMQHETPQSAVEALKNLVVPEDRDIFEHASREAITKGLEDYGFMYRFKSPDGKPRHMKNFARILRSEHGKPYRIIGATWDHSEEVAAAAHLQSQVEAARALSERLSLAIKAAGVAIWEIDLAAQRMLWIENPLSAQLAARVPDGDLRKLSQYTHPDDRQVMASAVRAALQEGRDTVHYVYRSCRPEGEVAHISTHAKLSLNAEKRAVRLLGVSSDITKEVAAAEKERQLAEKERQQAEQERALLVRFNLTTQAAGITTWEFDLKQQRFKVLGTRPSVDVLGMHSVSQDELYAHLKRVTLPEDKDVMEEAVRSAIAQNQDELSYRFRGRGMDDKVHHLKNHARLLRSEDGRPQVLVGVTWDYSEEVAANERLAAEVRRAQELKERLAVATLAAGISPWEIDLVAGKFLWVENPVKALSHLFKRGTLLSTFRDRIHPEDRDVFRHAAAHAAKHGGDIATYRYRAFGSDGAMVHVQCYAKLFFDAANRPTRALGVSWDVTKEVVAGEQLRLQAERLVDVEQRLERASISSSEGHWEADLHSGRLWYSSSFHTLLGYIDGELEPRTSEFERLVHADDLQAYRDALRNHLELNRPYDLQVRLLTASGEHRWIQLRGMAERDADSTPTLLAGSIQDIHQQKLVEDALQLAQQRFQRAIIGTQDGLWELDVLADQLWCSPRAALLLGYPAAQLEQDNFWRQLVHPEDSQPFVAATLAHYHSNAPFDIELRVRVRGGEYRWFRARATAERDANGRALRLSGSLQDVTEARVAREQLLRATEAAEAANRAKSDFLANMSHEIRTPMNGIVGMAGLLLDTTLDPAQRDYAHTIRHSADSLLLVINDILDLSQIETGKLELCNADFDLRALVNDVAGVLGHQATAKGLQLSVDVDAAVSARVHGDAKRLRQCLMNLAGNAIKFTSEGRVAIQVRVLEDRDRKLTSFQVLDTGIGIAPEMLPRLFQPFMQADTSSTRNFGGTGLGLSVVRRLVELMGGQVNVVSEVGKGSAFSFTVVLPAAAQSPQELQRVESPAAATQFSGRVLLVEDNPVNQKVATRVLQRLGLEIEVADNGQLGVERFTRGSFDIVFMDVQMPVMDGVTAAMRIRELETLELRRPTPICALTANALPADQERCKAAGMDDFLTKPLDVDRLCAVLRRFAVGAQRSELPVPAAAPPVVPAPTPPINLARFNGVTGGDPEFARELSELFIASANEQLQEARGAFEAGDRSALARVAHKLKGACANIHADGMRSLAAELELQASSTELARLQLLLGQLNEEFQRVRDFLSAMLSAGQAAASTAKVRGA